MAEEAWPLAHEQPPIPQGLGALPMGQLPAPTPLNHVPGAPLTAAPSVGAPLTAAAEPASSSYQAKGAARITVGAGDAADSCHLTAGGSLDTATFDGNAAREAAKGFHERVYASAKEGTCPHCHRVSCQCPARLLPVPLRTEQQNALPYARSAHGTGRDAYPPSLATPNIEAMQKARLSPTIAGAAQDIGSAPTLAEEAWPLAHEQQPISRGLGALPTGQLPAPTPLNHVPGAPLTAAPDAGALLTAAAESLNTLPGAVISSPPALARVDPDDMPGAVTRAHPSP